MQSLVFLEPNRMDAVPFTTSDVIAEAARIKHHAVQQLIVKHGASLKQFGIIAFEMRKLSGAGRPYSLISGRKQRPFSPNGPVATPL